MTEQDVMRIVSTMLGQNNHGSQFSVANVPFHTHNNADSPAFKFLNLRDVPNTYAGNAGSAPIVNPTENGLTFGAVAPSGGGTGLTTYTPYSVVAGGTTATGALQQVSGVGTAGQVLTSNGAGALPTWQSASGIYIGAVVGGSAGSPFPGGWSVSHDGTGAYTITHHLSTLNYVLVVTPMNASQVTINRNSTTSYVYTFNPSGSAFNSDFTFILIPG